MSLVAVYGPTEVWGGNEKEMFYDKLDSFLDQCPPTGIERAGYELCVGLQVSGTRNTNNSLLNFAKSRRLRIAGSWYQRPELHRGTWYSNAGGIAEEIDRILVRTRWRIFQNCRVFRSAEFFATDHRLLATLKLHVNSRKISRSDHNVFHLEKVKDSTCAHEYAVTVLNRFEVLDVLKDLVELWNTFKRETLEAPKGCDKGCPRSRWARFDGDAGQYRKEFCC